MRAASWLLSIHTGGKAQSEFAHRFLVVVKNHRKEMGKENASHQFEILIRNLTFFLKKENQFYIFSLSVTILQLIIQPTYSHVPTKLHMPLIHQERCSRHVQTQLSDLWKQSQERLLLCIRSRAASSAFFTN